jgi:hypothetical protein
VKLRAAASAVAVTLCASAPVLASSALESPDIGVVSLGRGGAWLVAADEPIAFFYNPAALVYQPSGVHLGAHVMFASHCFERLGPDGQPISPGGGLPAPPEGTEVCADVLPIPNPQLGANIHVLDRLAIGFGVVAPHATGKSDWPVTISYANSFGFDQEVPSPSRYMVISNDLLALFPTVAIAFAPIEELSFGAGFVWGVVRLKFETMAEATAPQPAVVDDFSKDVSAELEGIDGFVPGVVLSVAARPHRRVELAGWFRWSDTTSMDIDLFGKTPYYAASGEVIENPDITDIPAAGHFRVQIPMEAKVGVRYRHPREGNEESQEFVTKHDGFVRDSWSQDLFDLELDLTWANNSTIDEIEVTMFDRHAINGTPGHVPLDASQPHNWKDAFGFRLGGSVMPIPDFLAVRLGGWFESSSVDPEYLSLDFDAAMKGGIATGLGLRFGIVDVNAAYQHTFYAEVDNGGNGLIPTVSGDETTAPTYRSRTGKNGGRANRRIDEIALGATVHF